MAQSPTSKSAPLSGAAKDDVLGVGGDYVFTIADLLANDPGGAAKISTGTQFYFGTTTADRLDQAGYLAAHGIIDNHDGTYTLTADAIDFKYSVQIGNKGTWSQADVHVTAPEAHLGDNLFVENFDGYADSGANPLFAIVDLNAAHGWVGAQNSELGADGYSGIADTSPGATNAYWLDTQNSPGGINISHEFTDLTAPVSGKTAVLSFDIAKQALTYEGNPYATDPNAKLEFKIDGAVVATVNASDLLSANTMQHYDISIAAYADNTDNVHVLELVDSTATNGYVGFAVDSIKIQDWIV